MRISISVIAIALLGGCATEPLPSEQADPVPASRLYGFQQPYQGYATLMITRDRGFTGSACNAKITIDKNRAGDLAAGETAKFMISAGDHIIAFSACGGGLKEVQINAIPSAAMRYRISIDPSMSMDLAPTSF